MSVPEKWASQLQSITRVVFGFLVLRHGMEQVLGYPEASGVPATSLQGILNLIAFPGGALLMLGFFTRPVSLLLAAAHLGFWFSVPLQATLSQNHPLFGGRAPADPLLLNTVFFVYLALAGGGVWSVDRLLDRVEGLSSSSRWTAHALAVLRIVAGFLFMWHGLEKWFAMFGGRIETDLTFRWFAGFLENFGGALVIVGLFTRPTAFILSGEMAVAYFLAWAPLGFWPSFAAASAEAAILFSFLYLFLWVAGPGSWSLDGFLHRRRPGAAADRKQRYSPAVLS